MAKPRIFLSSTCYDLSMIRDELTNFLEDRGFEVINSERDSFGVTPGRHSQTVCLEAVDLADYLLLLIGKHRGGTYIGSEQSITNEEYNRAILKGIPCIVCVLREIEEYRATYKSNPGWSHSHIVDDPRIFHFIDYIASAHSDNWIHKFDKIEDIRKIITTQLAHYLYLYSQSIIPHAARQRDPGPISTPFPSNLGILQTRPLEQDDETILRNGLKKLHEIMTTIVTDNAKQDSKIEKLKCMWIFGRYGQIEWPQPMFGGLPQYFARISMKMDIFKQYAWSFGRANRVFNQFRPYNLDGTIEEGVISLWFVEEDLDTAIALALNDFVKTLLENYDEQAAIQLFHKADMRCYVTT